MTKEQLEAVKALWHVAGNLEDDEEVRAVIPHNLARNLRTALARMIRAFPPGDLTRN